MNLNLSISAWVFGFIVLGYAGQSSGSSMGGISSLSDTRLSSPVFNTSASIGTGPIRGSVGALNGPIISSRASLSAAKPLPHQEVANSMSVLASAEFGYQGRSSHDVAVQYPESSGTFNTDGLSIWSSGGRVDHTNALKAMDGDFQTGWQGVGGLNPNWLSITAAKPLRASDLSFVYGEESPTNVLLMVSTNLLQWSEFIPGQQSEPEPTHQYFWIIFPDSSRNKDIDVREISF